MTPQEKEEVRARTDIVELIGGYTPLKAVGRKFKGLCPFHTERTPSFHVDPEGTWRCFGQCGIGGDVFAFLMRAENLSFPEAAERLAERAGVTLTKNNGDTEAARKTQAERERLWAACAAAQRLFRVALRNNPGATEYADNRKLAPTTRENFGIGYAPDAWHALADALAREKIHTEDAEKAGLILPSLRNDGTFTDRFRARLMFPIFDVQERVIAFGGRIIVPSENAPKYLNSPETPIFSKRRTLYGLNRARRAIAQADRVVVVEGYMDVVAAHQAGVEYVVATLGTSVTEEHIALLRRYTKNVILSFDSDAAGLKAAFRAVDLFTATGGDSRLRVLTLPSGEDPDSMLRDGDPGAFLASLETAQTIPDFRLRVLEGQHDLKAEAGRVRFLEEALRVVAQVPELMEQDALIRKLAPNHPLFVRGGGMAEQSLRDEVNRLAQSPKSAPPIRLSPVSEETQDDALPSVMQWEKPRMARQKAEHIVVRALFDENLASRFANKIQIALFTPPLVPLVEAVLPQVSPTQQTPRLPDGFLQDQWEHIRASAPDEVLTPETVAACLTLLETERRKDELREMQTAFDDGDDALLREWQQKARDLQTMPPA